MAKKTAKENVYQNYNAKRINDLIIHGICVSNLAYCISKELEFDDEFCNEMALAGFLHDIGKVKAYSYIYAEEENEDKLNIEKQRYIRMHSELGYAILSDKGFSEEILKGVLYHHENYDGSGYPNNLSGEKIPLSARIIRVCDVFAALISDRPYRKAFSPNVAVELMIDEVKNFDMEIFLAFMRVIHEVDIDVITGGNVCIDIMDEIADLVK